MHTVSSAEKHTVKTFFNKLTVGKCLPVGAFYRFLTVGKCLPYIEYAICIRFIIYLFVFERQWEAGTKHCPFHERILILKKSKPISIIILEDRGQK